MQQSKKRKFDQEEEENGKNSASIKIE